MENKIKYLWLLLLYIVYSCNNPENKRSNPPEVTTPEPSLITYSFVDTLAHDINAFTQGLLIYNGYLLESTGLEEQSSINKIDTASGKIEVLKSDFNNQIFAEGIAIFKNKLFQLTYKNHLIFEYDINNIKSPIHQHSWPKEGWGMTSDSSSLIISDGSSKLYFLDPNTMVVKRELSVYDHMGAVDSLNELEYIDGYIYANVWKSDFIYKIDPKTGNVVGKISFEGIIQRYDKNFDFNGENVLNGIAWDDENKLMFVTGKNWPLIFKIKLN